MKVCVVGGTGNISSAFVPVLQEQGHEVVCYNRGKSGEVPAGVREIHGDRRADRPAFERAMQAEGFDAAIDMICFDRDDAESSLRAFRGVGQFVMCSTVCTYGIDYDWLPVSEDHPLRPITAYGRNKAAADDVFLAAWHTEGFPVTIIKPSTTYGRHDVALRQIAWEGTWVDRVRKGKPIVICGDGNALHSFLHVEDAALCFTGVLGKAVCLGQTYIMVPPHFTTWRQWHETAMQVLGREVELVGVPYATLKAWGVPAFGICEEIFAHHVIYSAAKLRRDVPEFQPRLSLADGMAKMFERLERLGLWPDEATNTWEDAIVAAQRGVVAARE